MLRYEREGDKVNIVVVTTQKMTHRTKRSRHWSRVTRSASPAQWWWKPPDSATNCGGECLAASPANCEVRSWERKRQ